MLADTPTWSLIETDNWGTLSPTYFYRFNGPGNLYCAGCAHNIRLVCCTKNGVRCLDCGQALAIDPQSVIHEDPSTTKPDPLSTQV